jgi:hypothetical protein
MLKKTAKGTLMKSKFKTLKFIDIIVITLITTVVAIMLPSCSLFKHDTLIGNLDGITRLLKPNGHEESTGNAGNTLSESNTLKEKGIMINPEGTTIAGRFLPPEGFERIPVGEDSFGAYLRNLPLKPGGAKVKYYNGETKPKDVHEAVIDIDVGNRDLQQCADAVMRLRAEYLYGRKMYDKISFNFVCGFKADYATWMQGNRIVVEGNNAYWVKGTGYSDDYKSFRQYMDMVFAYAGTESLEKEMKNIELSDMQIGDVFLKGSLPGHCVIIVDMAENKDTGEKLFIIAQSYMPAQDIHILKNNNDKSISPWYSADFGEILITPEWKFTRDQLYRFDD